MSDLISREMAIAEAYNVVIDGEVFKVVQVETLYGLPTIEPKKGKWIKRKDAMGKDIYICSNCETEVLWRDMRGVLLRVDMQNANFCPNCGAKMVSE